MRIGLYNLEPHIVNSAMMRVSTYHKNKGDEVDFYYPLLNQGFDKTYAFSIFDYTNKGYVTDNIICGGSGFNVKKKLPKEMESQDYDWSLYPSCDYSLLWFSTGCIRNCPFCIVREKEGYIKPVKPKNLNPKGKYIKVMDNNFFANPEWKRSVSVLKIYNQHVDFQGIDARILTDEMCYILNSFKHFHQIKTAWDNPKEDLEPKLKQIIEIIPAYKLMCYVLIGYWSTKEEDLYRVEKLRELKIDPFVMPYDKYNEYQKDFARWVNHKAIFNSIPWKIYYKNR